MVPITTLAAINETVMSVDFRNCLIEIDTADAQLSHEGGVLIVVTGSLTPSEGICRKFTQSFFLAPQESGGYFVLNDVLRFISERQPAEINPVATRENESGQIATSASETCSALSEQAAAEKSSDSYHVTVENKVTKRQVIHPCGNGTTVENDVSTTKPPMQVAKEDPQRASQAPLLPTPTHRDVAKKSYASIVKDMKEGPPAVPDPRTVPKHKQPNTVTKLVEVPVKSPVKPKPDTKDVEVSVKSPAKPKPGTKDVEVPVKSPVKTAQDETTASDGIIAESNSLRNDHGYSVFVRNLPFYAHIQFVEEEFKKFGAIKPGGVQVVHHKLDGFCFGFVEYESQNSMQAAIEASPVRIGEKQVYVEKKRAPTRVTRGGGYHGRNRGEGGNFQAGRGVYRGDNFGGQGVGYAHANDAGYRGGNGFNHRNEGHDNYNNRNDGGGNYNHRGDNGENYNRRGNGGENYNRRSNGGENYNRRGDAGADYNRRVLRDNGGKSFNRRGNGGENYNPRGDGGENYNPRGNGGVNNNNRRDNMGEDHNSRNGGGENYNRRTDAESFNRRNFRNQNEFSRGSGYRQNGNGFQPPHRPVQNGHGRPAASCQ